jgi:Pectate lyase superfamily protein
MSQGQGNITFSGNSTNSGSGGGGGGTLTGITEGPGIKITPSATSPTVTNRLNWFFVQQYGAKGDGATDDTAAIQAAFTAAGALGNGAAVVYFAPGNYKITAVITWPNSTIWAFGAGSNYPGGLGISQILMDSPTENAFVIPAQGCKVTDLYFMQTGGTATAGAAILGSGFRLTVRDCLFQGFWNGIQQTEQVTSLIDHCVFLDQVNHCIDTTNSNPDEGDGLVVGCTFSSFTVPTAAGFFQNGSGGQKISGCKFVSAVVFMVNCIECVFGPSTSTSDLLISNCSIEQYTGAGILVNVQAGGEFYNVTVVGCNISSYNAGAGIVLVGTGGNLFNVCVTGCSITNNVNGVSITDVNKVSISGTLFNAGSNNIVQAGANDNIFYDRWFHTVSAPTSGSTVNLAKWTFAAIAPGTPIAALTLNLPSSPLEGNECEYSLESVVTALSFTGGVVAGPAANQVGFRKLKYDEATTTWY